MTALPQRLQRLLAIDAYPTLPFSDPVHPRLGDLPARALEVARARVAGRNPDPPAWRMRAVNAWQVDGAGPGPAGPRNRRRALLHAVAAVWNEDDIIYALTEHLFAQGADRVIVIDDASDDATREEAADAGADVILVESDGTYSERVRSSRVQTVIADETTRAGEDVWWLIVDGDEFPRGPDGRTVRELIEDAPDWVDVVGSRVLDHLPPLEGGYIQRQPPLPLFPLARWYHNPYCPRGHWKHPLIRVRTSGDITPMPGHHTVRTADRRRAREFGPTLLTHHFPLRDRDRTEAKLRRAARPGSRYAASPDSFTRWRVQQRLAAMDDLYAGRYDRVPSGYPGGARRGIRAVDWRTLVPPSERTLR